MQISVTQDDVPTTHIVVDPASIRRFTRLEPKSILIADRRTPLRPVIERFVEDRYADAFGASQTVHYPFLMCACDADGEPVAAVGFREAGAETLFLEKYLARPVEDELSRRYRTPVARNAIVEIGSLASNYHGASIFLFVALAKFLRDRGLTYAVATATRALRRNFSLLGFETTELAPAVADCLGDDSSDWGSYYDRDPRVLAGRIPSCMKSLDRFMPSHPADLSTSSAEHPRHAV